MINTHTIAAIATPLGVGGIGIIRLSGDHALSIIRHFLPDASVPSSPEPRYVYFTPLIHPDTQQLLDEVCLIYFKGPQSYTGEDVVELHCHGSSFLLKNILSLLIAHGAELATPGEFTRRAFVNGKMDLSKAESVIDVIHATSEKSHQVALGHLKGHLATHINGMRQSLITLLEQMDGSIEFPDEVPELPREQLSSTCTTLLEQLSTVINLEDYGERIQHGVRVAIVGAPNAGKSSLLNQLVGHERAIVTPIPGTTRDFIEASTTLGGITFTFVDTAGLRDAEDVVEQLGIEQVQHQLDRAHLILWVVDGSEPYNSTLEGVYSHLSDYTHVIRLQNKTDALTQLEWPEQLKHLTWPLFFMSAKTGDGIQLLKDLLYDTYVEDLEHIDLDLLCNARQLGCLKQTQKSLTDFLDNVAAGMDDAVLTIDLRQAITQLGQVTGDALTEELLDGIFSRFCVGK